MFSIEDAPSSATKCDWCSKVIRKGEVRLRFAPLKGYRSYWHQECGITYLEGLLVLLKDGVKGRIGRVEAERAREAAGK